MVAQSSQINQGFTKMKWTRWKCLQRRVLLFFDRRSTGKQLSRIIYCKRVSLDISGQTCLCRIVSNPVCSLTVFILHSPRFCTLGWFSANRGWARGLGYSFSDRRRRLFIPRQPIRCPRRLSTHGPLEYVPPSSFSPGHHAWTAGVAGQFREGKTITQTHKCSFLLQHVVYF